MPRKTKTRNRPKPKALASANCSETGSRFKTLFERAKQSPAYWLQGVIVEIGEYRHDLEVIPIRTRDIEYELRGVRKCYRMAEREMRRYEKSQNDQADAHRKEP